MMDFTDLIIRGISLFHCHLLSHEDKGMMAKILFKCEIEALGVKIQMPRGHPMSEVIEPSDLRGEHYPS
jgi:Multicopper oxidase